MNRISIFLGAAFVLLLLFAFGNVYAEGRPFIPRWSEVAEPPLRFSIVGDNYPIVTKNADENELEREAITVEAPKTPYNFTSEATPVTLALEATNSEATTKRGVTVTEVVAPTALALSQSKLSLYVMKNQNLALNFTPSDYLFRDVNVSAIPEGYLIVYEKNGIVFVMARDRPTPAGHPVKVVVTNLKDNSLQATCEVTILPLEQPTQITLDKEKEARHVGDLFSFQLSFNPEANVDSRVTITTEPEGFVATKMQANLLIVTALKETTTPVKITLTSEGTPTVQATCEVTVLPPASPTQRASGKS